MLKLIQKIKNFSEQSVQRYSAQYKLYGLFGAINFPVSLFIWWEVIKQEHVGVVWRIINTVLCLGLLCKDYWPRRFSSYLPVFWHFTLLISLSTFGAFMLLKNNLSTGWAMNTTLGVLYLIVLVDWLSFFILLFSGIALGTFFYILSGGDFSSLAIESETLILTGNMYLFIIIAGLFARNNEQSQQEKASVLRTFSSTMAHEMRTPLSAIGLISKQLRIMITRIKGAYENSRPMPISKRDIRDLTEICEGLDYTSASSNMFIKSLIFNLKDLKNISQEEISIGQCLSEILAEFPFQSNKEKNLITVLNNKDFMFIGDKEVIKHVIFNLIQNSLYFIDSSAKGNIEINTDNTVDYNTFIFRDTGPGIDPNVLPLIFDRFFTTRPLGTGIGLNFCKNVMEALNGRIEVSSTLGKETIFKLFFPKIETSKN